MAQGKGFGKTILFGEHFVVYGMPAVASAIGDYTLAEVEPSKKTEIIDNRPATEGYKETKREEMQREFGALFRFFGVKPEKNPLKITLSGNLFCTSGVGASAALAVSISRALNDMLGLGMDDEKINNAAYAAEEAGSGKPSGIDNTCSTYGGLLWFAKGLGGRPNTMKRLSIRKPVEIVLGNTGITQETKVVVDDVAAWGKESPDEFRQILDDYAETASKGKQAMQSFDMRKVGLLMDRNQELLRRVGVSCNEIENIIGIAKDNGAAGAKLTGTGRGGYVICLTPGEGLQGKVAKAIEAAGFGTLKTTIG